MKLTFIGLNSWLLNIDGLQILIDPWLVDSVVFYGSPWLFEAKRVNPPCYTPTTLPTIDLILISQSLDDHCHQPTLAQLSKQIPVIAVPSAVKIVKKLGYDRVIPLVPWENYTLDERVKITATPGAKIQGQLENGFLINLLQTDKTLYYEPHLATDRETIDLINKRGKIDAIIAPIVGQIFPLLGKVIMNSQDAFALASILQPQWYLPTAVGEIHASGILPQLTRSDGTIEEFAKLLADSQIATKLLMPRPGETVSL
ncbi:MBL fold metallo-hydrolase [Chamaesiphon sp. VAR_48_metabat_135_sub]|uniref:MBL fold metallo-hydrolase n=1 Tax=Chamaesiphon sp. VAR_48_metabat_135_sub TaxID=2964699 RepID=UPI00286AAF2D|nr:MBL fold metallo-hydrolase [Chamaesiphon sp. VAR_48_metabat_135_sub]